MSTLHRTATITLLALALAASLPLVAAAPATAADCDRYASSNGNDGSNGTTVATAFRTLAKLTSSLTAGQTGCLVDGSVFDANRTLNGAGTAGAPVTIRSQSTNGATVLGQTHVHPDAHDIVFEGIRFAGLNYAKSTMLIVSGDRITFRRNDVSSPLTICIDIKKGSSGVRILDNRIHDCGNGANWTSSDSGAHGIYIQEATDVTISGNFIYRNQYRGVQTWPGANGVTIKDNVFFQNGTHVNLGHDGSTMSRNVTITNNVMSDATLYRSNEWKNISSVHGYLPQGSQLNNLVAANCIHQANRFEGLPELTGYGFTAEGNTIAESPIQFANAARGDFTLAAGSPCGGFGPASIQANAAPTIDNPGVACDDGAVHVDVEQAGATLGLDPSAGYWLLVYVAQADGSWATSSWVYSYGERGGYWELGRTWQRLDGPTVTVESANTADDSAVWVGRWMADGNGWNLEWFRAGTC